MNDNAAAKRVQKFKQMILLQQTAPHMNERYNPTQYISN